MSSHFGKFSTSLAYGVLPQHMGMEILTVKHGFEILDKGI